MLSLAAYSGSTVTDPVKDRDGPFAEVREPFGAICMLSARAGAARRANEIAVAAKRFMSILSSVIGCDCSTTARTPAAVGHRQACPSSAAGALHHLLRVAVSLYHETRRDAVDLAQVVGGQFDRGRAEVLLQAVQLRRAGDRHDPRLLRQQPGERDLRGRRPLALRDRAEQVDQRLVRLARLGREAGNGVAEVGAVERRVLVDLARSGSPCPAG